MTLRTVNVGGSGCDALDCGSGVSGALRLEANRAKLAERRAGILSSNSRRSLLRRRSSYGDLPLPAAAKPEQERLRGDDDDDCRFAVRRYHSDPTIGQRNVTFSSQLVTDVKTRPYTDPADRRELFYSKADYALFKARRHDRDVEISFPPGGMVTEVWEPKATTTTTVGEEENSEDSEREALYYTQEELQGFLKEFLATLEGGVPEEDDDDDDDDSDDCHNDEADCAGEAEEDVEACKATTATDDLEIFDDVPLDDGGSDDFCAVPTGIEDSDGDDSSESSDEEDYRCSNGPAAVWPNPSSALTKDLAPLPVVVSPECCRRSSALTDEVLYAASETVVVAASEVVVVAGEDDDSDDEWDAAVNRTASSSCVMGQRLPSRAVPIMG